MILAGGFFGAGLLALVVSAVVAAFPARSPRLGGGSEWRHPGCWFRRDQGAAVKKNGPTRLGQGQKVGFAHAPVQEQGDVKHIARGCHAIS